MDTLRITTLSNTELKMREFKLKLRLTEIVSENQALQNSYTVQEIDYSLQGVGTMGGPVSTTLAFLLYFLRLSGTTELCAWYR